MFTRQVLENVCDDADNFSHFPIGIYLRPALPDADHIVYLCIAVLRYLLIVFTLAPPFRTPSLLYIGGRSCCLYCT